MLQFAFTNDEWCDNELNKTHLHIRKNNQIPVTHWGNFDAQLLLFVTLKTKLLCSNAK